MAVTLDPPDRVPGSSVTLDPMPGSAVNPPTPGEIRRAPSVWETVAPEILPTAGWLGGGALGALAGAATTGPLAPVGAATGGVVGGGLGYAAGLQANDAVRAFMNYLHGTPQAEASDALGTLLRMGKNVVVGSGMTAAGDVLGLGVNKAAGALGDILRASGIPGFGSKAAADLAAQQAAQREGIVLPASAATSSRTLAALEATPGRFPLGVTQQRNFYDRTALSAQRAAERLAQSAGPDVGLEAAGRSIQSDIATVAGAQEAAADAALKAHEAELARLGTAQEVQAQGFQGTAAQEAQAAIDRFLQQFGGGQRTGGAELSGTRLGQDVQAALEAAQQEARTQIAPLYTAIREEASAAGSAVPMTSTAGVAQSILDLENRLGALGRSAVQRPAGSLNALASPEMPATVSELPATLQEQVIKNFGLDQPQAIQPDLALELQKRLAAAVRNAPDDVSRRAIVQLRDAVSRDLENWAGVSGSNVGPLRQQAAEAYKAQIVPFFSEGAPLRARLMDVEPEVAGQRLLSLRDPQLLQDAMRFLPADLQNRLRATILSGLPREAAGFEQGLSRFSPDALTALLGPDQTAALSQLRQQLGSGQSRLANRLAMSEAVRGADIAGRQADFAQRMDWAFGRGARDPQLEALANQRGSVEGLVNSLTKGRYKSLEDFDTVWQAISPESQQQMRSAMLNRVLEESFDPQSGQFSIARFLSRKAEVPDDVWQRMLSHDQIGSLRDMTTALQRITNYARPASNPSGTAQAGVAAIQYGAGAHLLISALQGNLDLSSPTTQGELLAVFGPLGLAQMYRPGAQRFLMRVPGQEMGPGLDALSRLLGVGAVQGASAIMNPAR